MLYENFSTLTNLFMKHATCMFSLILFFSGLLSLLMGLVIGRRQSSLLLQDTLTSNLCSEHTEINCMQTTPYFALTFCPAALWHQLAYYIFLWLPHYYDMAYFSSWFWRSLLILAKKKTQRNWQMTFSFSQRSKPCLQRHRQICRPSHVILPPSPWETHGSAANQQFRSTDADLDADAQR